VGRVSRVPPLMDEGVGEPLDVPVPTSPLTHETVPAPA
jgi:hypothetical protein